MIKSYNIHTQARKRDLRILVLRSVMRVLGDIFWDHHIPSGSVRVSATSVHRNARARSHRWEGEIFRLYSREPNRIFKILEQLFPNLYTRILMFVHPCLQNDEFVSGALFDGFA